MPDTQPLILYSQSGTAADWRCPRYRYLGHEYQGVGLTTDGTHLELYLGSALHDGLAALAHGVAIEDIAKAAFQQVNEALLKNTIGEIEAEVFAAEQGTLVEGLLRGFAKHAWPRLRAEYPDIIHIEKELLYKHDGLGFMSKPDLLVRDKEGSIWYIEFKSTSSNKDQWANSWSTAIQLHSGARAVEAMLGEKVTGVIVQGLYKGYCLVPDIPVLTTDLKWVQVGSLIEGDKLVAFDETSGNNRSGGKSLRQWQEGIVTSTGRTQLPCYEIELEDGTKFTCSENHKWLTAYKTQGMGSAVWRTTEELKSGVSRIVKLIEPWDGLGEFDPYEAGYLAAAYDGEGNLSTMHFDRQGDEYYSLNLGFSQNPNLMMQYMKDLLDKYGLVWSGGSGIKAHGCETIQLYGKINLLGLLGKIRPKRLLPKLDFNKLGMVKDVPCRPQKVIRKQFVGVQEVVTLETSTGTFIANGFASHNSSYGKQGSPFCYSYHKPAVPPFRDAEWAYEYKAGLKRVPTWLMDGGVQGWVEDMPEDVLSAQFPQAPPIFLNENLIDAFFVQRAVRETEIGIASRAMQHPEQTHDDKQSIMTNTFPQRFDQCMPAWGKPCPFRKICHGGGGDPLEHGFVLRDLSHREPYVKLAEGK